MSEALKRDLARELGVADIVSHEGWGGVSARNCGNLVKLAVQRAEAALADQYGAGRAETVAAYPRTEALPYWAEGPGPRSRMEEYRS